MPPISAPATPIATSSCTGAMHMGLAALGIGGAGDEVILADTNWIATRCTDQASGRRARVRRRASRYLVGIDPAEVERRITPRTRAIIATHIYGNLCDMDALLDISRRTGIPVAEDAAEAIGSVWHGRRAGSMGVFGTFSFHGTKTLTTGEGGMFVTSDADLYEKVLTLSNHGRARSQRKQFWPDAIGFKYKMSNIQAALGCAQLERIEELVSRKREILAAYMVRLSTLNGISMNPEYTGTINGRLDADSSLPPRHRHHPRSAAAGLRNRQYRCARLLPPAFQPVDVCGKAGQHQRLEHSGAGYQPPELSRHERGRYRSRGGNADLGRPQPSGQQRRSAPPLRLSAEYTEGFRDLRPPRTIASNSKPASAKCRLRSARTKTRSSNR